MGILAAGERAVSTTNRNFVGSTVYCFFECSSIYAIVLSSTGKIPFLAPASIAMFAMAKRSSIERFATPSPVNSSERYNAKDKVVLVPDHFAPNKDIKSAEHCKCVREYAKEHDITNYFEVGKMGNSHSH